MHKLLSIVQVQPVRRHSPKRAMPEVKHLQHAGIGHMQVLGDKFKAQQVGLVPWFWNYIQLLTMCRQFYFLVIIFLTGIF